MEWFRLSEEFRGNVRHFAFLIGNGALVPNDIDDTFDYEVLITKSPQLLPALFAIFLNNMQFDSEGVGELDPEERAAAWLYQIYNSNYNIIPPIQDWETSIENSNTIIGSIVNFVDRLISSTLDPLIFDAAKHLAELFEGGSFLEGIIAVYTNILEVNSTGDIRNAAWAEKRAQQFAKHWVDNRFRVDPPFEAWEVELV